MYVANHSHTSFIATAQPSITPRTEGHPANPPWPQYVQRVFQNPAERLYFNETLMVLQPLNSADANGFWLTRHLLRLSDQARQEPQARAQGIDTAAHYFVMHSVWFHSHSAQGHPLLANQLSKHQNSRVCAQALACIAQYVANALDLSSLDNKSLALLVNAFAKHPDNPTCRHAVLSLALILVEKHTGMGRQNLTLSLNALSKWPNHQQAITAILGLAERITTDHALRQGMTLRKVSNSVDALHMCPTQVQAKMAALSLANRLATDTRLLQNMTLQEANANINALRAWPDEEQALMTVLTLAKQINNDDTLWRNMTTQEVDSSLNALRRWLHVLPKSPT